VDKDTLLEPLLLKATAPLKLLPLCVKLMAFAPAVKEEMPPTVSAATWPMPAPVAVKFVPMVEAAKFKAWVLVMLAVVPLTRETLPVKLLLAPLVVKLIELPALRVVVPGTVTVPVWLMAPPAVKDKLPPLFKVTLGKAMLAEALLKFRVKLRKAVKAVKFVGAVAAALILVKLKSWTLFKVAPEAKVMAPLILLAWSRMMLEASVFSVKVKTPVAEAAWVIAPVCVM